MLELTLEDVGWKMGSSCEVSLWYVWRKLDRKSMFRAMEGGNWEILCLNRDMMVRKTRMARMRTKVRRGERRAIERMVVRAEAGVEENLRAEYREEDGEIGGWQLEACGFWGESSIYRLSPVRLHLRLGTEQEDIDRVVSINELGSNIAVLCYSARALVKSRNHELVSRL